MFTFFFYYFIAHFLLSIIVDFLCLSFTAIHLLKVQVDSKGTSMKIIVIITRLEWPLARRVHVFNEMRSQELQCV